MLRKWLICIFSLCVLQLTFARPLRERTFETELQRLIEHTVEDGRALFKDTLRELNALPEKSEALQANITRVSGFIGEAADLDLSVNEKNYRILADMSKLAEIVVDYKKMPEGDKLTETLKTAFEKSGWQKFESEFEKRFTAYADHLKVRFKLYMNEPEIKDHPNLISWFDKFTAKTDGEWKVELAFDEFINMVD